MQPLLAQYDRPTELGRRYSYDSSGAYLFPLQEAPALEYECLPDQGWKVGPED